MPGEGMKLSDAHTVCMFQPCVSIGLKSISDISAFSMFYDKCQCLVSQEAVCPLCIMDCTGVHGGMVDGLYSCIIA